jgi:hypothetical protein
MMTEEEANRIAEAIKDAATDVIHIESVEQNPKTNRFQVLCRYKGPTFKHGQQLFLHGMPICIKNSYEWTKLHTLLKKA